MHNTADVRSFGDDYGRRRTEDGQAVQVVVGKGECSVALFWSVV